MHSSNRKPTEIWVDQRGWFYNNLLKRFLKNNNIESYSTCDERKSAVAERFITTLKNKIFNHITAVSKNDYFNVLGDVVDKWNKTVHKIIKMKPIDSFAECNEYSNEKDPKFKTGDRVRISKYKHIFVKGFTQNWSEEVSIISKVKNIVP